MKGNNDTMINYFINMWQKMLDNTIEWSKKIIEEQTRILKTESETKEVESHSIIVLTERQTSILNNIIKSTTVFQRLVLRARIILFLGKGKNIMQVARIIGLKRKTVRKWLYRWLNGEPRLEVAHENRCKDKKLYELIEEILKDAPRKGRNPIFSPEQIVKIVALACEDVKKIIPISHWTLKELAAEAIRRKIVDDISVSTVFRILDEAVIKPHRMRYWCNSDPKDPIKFENAIREICELYKEAFKLYEEGVYVVSTDEKTGIQANERLYPTKLGKPGDLERVEQKYKRHGTTCLIANFLVATGCIFNSTLGPSRTEEDFLRHIKKTVEVKPKGRWIFIVDNLNIHMSASLVKWVAEQCGITEDLGIKGKSNILKTKETRAKFLSNRSHNICFVYTPKGASWINQIEIWFSILVRKLLKRSSYKSVNEVEKRITEFIDYFNNEMAKPFKWTYSGKVLTV